MIIDEIKKANIQALKDKDQVSRSIYSIVMNKHLLLSVEARTSGKELTDADMVKIITKTIKELAEEQANYEKVGNAEKAAQIAAQKGILEKYLPKMLSMDEIKSIIAGLEDKSVPSVMKHFKANYNGTVDMRMVQDALR